jgi:bla regulator protein blaR1
MWRKSQVVTNHLLQSTAFALAAGLLTLFLRNNHARTRYWIWLTASLKFLIPFSIFIELGHRLAWSSAPAISQPQLALVIDEVSQPFTIATPAPVVNTPMTPSVLLPAIWICGSAAVLIFWFIRWRRTAALLRTSDPQLEPGVFGIFRPVLYLPAGISEHLDDAQLKAIVAHEQCHIRRRDNLTAALHMLVEAVFWFHPLVWWIGTRLVDERERACDEEVVQSGSDPEVYAESVLKVCRLYLESPLACVSGISGSDLKKRIEAIMINRVLLGLSPAKKAALASLAFLALITPIAIGILSVPAARAEAQASPPETTPLSTLPAFEAASVKENHSASRDMSWGCRGTDGKVLSEVQADSFRIAGYGDVPLGRCVGRNVPLKWLVSWAYQIS